MIIVTVPITITGGVALRSSRSQYDNTNGVRVRLRKVGEKGRVQKISGVNP